MKLYISDLHFFHENSIKLDGRTVCDSARGAVRDAAGAAGAAEGTAGFGNDIASGSRLFESTEEMTEYMIAKWNGKVRGGDIVIVLGDMFWASSADEKSVSQINRVLNRLNGKICLIEGNHDAKWLKLPGIKLDRFEWIKPYGELSDGDKTVILSHYPVFCYNHQYQTLPDGSPRTFMMYGHVHNTHDEVLVNEFIRLTREAVIPGDGNVLDRKIPCNMINCFCKFSDYTPLSLKEWIELDKNRRKKINRKN